MASSACAVDDRREDNSDLSVLTDTTILSGSRRVSNLSLPLTMADVINLYVGRQRGLGNAYTTNMARDGRGPKDGSQMLV